MEQPHHHHPLRDGHPARGGEPRGRDALRGRAVHPRPPRHPVRLLAVLQGKCWNLLTLDCHQRLLITSSGVVRVAGAGAGGVYYWTQQQHCAVLNLEKCDTSDRVSRASNQPHLHTTSTALDLYLGIG